MKKWFIPLLLLLTIINLSALATFAYHRLHSSKPMGRCSSSAETCALRLQQKLDLSEAQKQQLQQYQADYEGQSDSLARALNECRVELVQCLLQNPADSVAAERISSRMDALQSQLLRRVVNHLLEQKKYLSDQQQEKLFSMILKQCSLANKSCCSQ